MWYHDTDRKSLSQVSCEYSAIYWLSRTKKTAMEGGFIDVSTRASTEIVYTVTVNLTTHPCHSSLLERWIYSITSTSSTSLVLTIVTRSPCPSVALSSSFSFKGHVMASIASTVFSGNASTAFQSNVFSIGIL